MIILPLTAVRSGIEPNLTFPSCVGYFYRVYNGLKVIILLLAIFQYCFARNVKHHTGV